MATRLWSSRQDWRKTKCLLLKKTTRFLKKSTLVLKKSTLVFSRGL